MVLHTYICYVSLLKIVDIFHLLKHFCDFPYVFYILNFKANTGSPFSLRCDNPTIETVVEFKYIGSTIHNSGSCQREEVKLRIGQVNASFRKLANLVQREVLCPNQVEAVQHQRSLEALL